MTHSWPPFSFFSKYFGPAVKLLISALVLIQAIDIAFSAFQIISSSPKALMKCLVRPVMRMRCGFTEVNVMVSPILYLQRPALVVMRRAYT